MLVQHQETIAINRFAGIGPFMAEGMQKQICGATSGQTVGNFRISLIRPILLPLLPTCTLMLPPTTLYFGASILNILALSILIARCSATHEAPAWQMRLP